MNSFRLRASLVACMVAVLASALSANAAEPRATGQYKPWQFYAANRSAGRRINHARDYAREIRRYTVQTPQAVPVLGPEDSAEVARNIEGAKKDLSTAKKHAGEDKDVLARIAAIEKHLEAATAQQKEMHSECCKPSPDNDKAMACCSDCLKELDHARAEYEALMRLVDPTKGAKDAKKDAAHDHDASNKKDK